MVRALIIDDDARASAARVLSHAEKHHYSPGQKPPGDDDRFVARLGTYRAVFSFTHADGTLWRHLSVSVPAKGKLPNPVAVFTIAKLFGFTGYDEAAPFKPAPDWGVNVNDDEHCVVVAQALRTTLAPEKLS